MSPNQPTPKQNNPNPQKNKQPTQKKQPAKQTFSSKYAGAIILFFGVGFIVTSLIQMTALLDYTRYRYLFQQYSETAILSRFITSWIVRFIGLAIGFGVLFRIEIFRKATLILAGGTIAVAYWKHPYEGFLRHIEWVNEHAAAMGFPMSPSTVVEIVQSTSFPEFTESTLVSLTVVTIIIWEIFCALTVLYFLTRPPIKALFR